MNHYRYLSTFVSPLALMAFLAFPVTQAKSQGKTAPAFSIENNCVSFRTDAVQTQIGPPAIELLLEKQIVKLIPSEQTAVSAEHSETPLGPAEAKTWKWHDPRGFEYTRTVTRLTERQGFTVKMTFTNRTQSAVRLHTFILGNKIPEGLRGEGAPENWVLSSLAAKGRASNLATDGRLSSRDILTLFTQHGAKGLVMGPAGPGESDLVYSAEISRGGAALQILSDMNDVVVDPGETRRSEELLVLAEPYESALTSLFKWMAVTHGARTARGPVFGWCSWYSLWKNVSEKTTEDALGAIVANQDRLPMQVFQLDDGWQKAYGDWEADPKKFPNGMKPIADKISAAGMIPGLWLTMVTTSTNGAHPDGNPDKNLDPTNPATREFITKTLKKRYADGFRYFKLDFNYPRMNDRYNQKLTRLQVRRDMFKLYRDAIGEDSYLCACVGSLDRGAIGFADSVRIGTDSGPRWLPRYSGCCMADLFNEVGANALSNGILFAADPDVAYTVPEKYTAAPPLPNSVRVWHGWVGLLGGVMMTSDNFHVSPWNTDSSIRMMEILNPPAPEKGRAFDGQTDLSHPQFGFVASRPWGNFISVQLLNLKEESAKISLKGLPLAKIGPKFHLWSFWDRKYLGVADENLQMEDVPAGGGPLLRLTEIPKDPSQPVIIGSDLHIGMGSAEIKEIVTGAKFLRVELTDAGARSGALFFHSTKPLSVHQSNGMEVQSVTNEGPEIWKISMVNRQRGKLQTIELNVGL